MSFGEGGDRLHARHVLEEVALELAVWQAVEGQHQREPFAPSRLRHEEELSVRSSATSSRRPVCRPSTKPPPGVGHGCLDTRRWQLHGAVHGAGSFPGMRSARVVQLPGGLMHMGSACVGQEEERKRSTEAEASERCSSRAEVQGADGSGEAGKVPTTSGEPVDVKREEKGNAEGDTQTKVTSKPPPTKPIAVLKKNKPIVAVRRRPDGSAPPATKRVKQDDGVCPSVTVSVPRVRASRR